VKAGGAGCDGSSIEQTGLVRYRECNMADEIYSYLPQALLLTAILLVVLPTFIRRFLAGIREKAIYKTERTLTTDRPLPRFALPYVVIIWCISPIIGIICAPLLEAVPAILADFYQGDLTGFEKLPVVLVGMANVIIREFTTFEKLPLVLVAIAVVIIHLRPNHSRELKYTLLIGAMPAFTLFMSGPEVLAGFIFASNESFIPFLLLIQLILWPVCAFVAASWYMSYWVRTRDVTQCSSIGPYVFSFFRSRSLGPVSLLCLFFFPSLAIVLFTGRYVLVEAFRRHPIIYLRSFHHEEAARTFGRAISPALGPFGVIKALVHGSQTGRLLLSGTSIWQFGIVTTVSDASWQTWVSEAIQNCSLAVIDCTVRTESVDWEIQTSLGKLDPSRILVINMDYSGARVMPHGVSAVPYSIDRRGLARLRSQVTSWAHKALNIDERRARRVRRCAWLLLLGVVALEMFVAQFGALSFFMDTLILS
jgi:hypothetical protein